MQLHTRGRQQVLYTRAFSLVELLVVVTILLFLAVLSMRSMTAYSLQQQTQQTQQAVVSILQHAKEYSQSAWQDQAYGVQFASSTVVLYATNATSTPIQTIDMPTFITVYPDLSNQEDWLNFTRRVGTASTEGTIYLYNSALSATTSITILSSGLVE